MNVKNDLTVGRLGCQVGFILRNEKDAGDGRIIMRGSAFHESAGEKVKYSAYAECEIMAKAIVKYSADAECEMK